MSENRRLSLLVILFALTFPTLVTWIYFVALRTSPPPVQQAAYTVGKAIQFIFPVIWVWKVRRQDLRWVRPHTRGLWLGLGFGLLIGVAMWLLYTFGLKPIGYFAAAQEHVRAKVTGMGLDSLAKYAALGVFYAVCHSFLEEYYWRWFVFREVRSVNSLPAGILVSSLGFMAHHIIVLATFFGWSSPATWLFSGCVAIGGAVWGWLYERSQSLLGPWISHCVVDAAIFWIGYDLISEVLH